MIQSENSLLKFQTTLNLDNIGREMYSFISDIFPICRSITGNGIRDTLRFIQGHAPLEVHEVPSGTQAFDWIVPKEWNILDAYIKNAAGERVVDFKKSNLHVVSYSVPVRKKLSLGELKEHVFTLPQHPDWIPYRTSYYEENWGFCMTHRQWSSLQDEEYDVCINSSLEVGHLTYGELYLRGKTPDEVLISCHACHPSLCNDNLSGIALATFLAKTLTAFSLRYTYRFLFVPGTIGAITWLSLNEPKVDRIKHGIVLTGVGDRGKIRYKKSRRGDAEIDKVIGHVLRHSGCDYEIIDFFPYGYDERQYCSPAFNLPVGCLMRTPHGCYPEYHTSADNLDFVQPHYLAHSFSTVLSTLSVLENNKTYLNLNPKCEPQLGRRGLYKAIGGQNDTKSSEMAMLWVLNLADGKHTLLDIADKSGFDFRIINEVALALSEKELLVEEVTDRGTQN